MELKIYPNEILLQKTLEVASFNNKELEDILQEMKDCLIKENALGLAANQLGYNYAIFIMKDKRGDIYEFINPTILETDGHQMIQEGCLSFPGITVTVNRAKNVVIRAQDRTGEMFEKVAYDMDAVCIQHEYDHLQGITFLDHLNRHDRRKILKQMGIK